MEKEIQIKYTKNHFNIATKLTWDDVIEKINNEFKNKTHKFVVERFDIPPTFVLHNNFLPKTIKYVFDEVNSKMNTKVLHIYTSFGQDSATFRRHKDQENVLIVQSIGSVCYLFDDDQKYTLNPGDSIFIPKYIYHDPIVLSPRVTLSFSW